ncbi:hypothetical protein EVAR_74972_1 [Eumeta japonica]|uniref:Uncharacterized protein n=1 Tax=Eumeta variegata TaxID=151549 RepID=A0A4C1VAM4_EUMVA|nr:hypothetical protein EVAR_74972_1 [Eumeta japonica]
MVEIGLASIKNIQEGPIRRHLGRRDNAVFSHANCIGARRRCTPLRAAILPVDGCQVQIRTGIGWPGEVPHSHRIQTEETVSALAFGPANESSDGFLLLHHRTPLTAVRYPIPTQEAGNVLVNPVGGYECPWAAVTTYLLVVRMLFFPSNLL